MLAHSPVRQFLWKEYRQQRSFWLSLLVVAVLVQALIVVLSVLNDQPPSITVLFGIAWGFPCLFALGSGATVFAGEHDSGTYATLRAWPATPRPMITGKVIATALGLIMMPLVLSAIAAMFSRFQFPSMVMQRDLVLGGLVASLELLAWGMFFSLQIQRPLWAVVFAAAAAAFFGFVAIPIAVSGFIHSYTPTGYLATLPFRAGLALFVLLVDFWLAQGWLDENPRRLTNPFARLAKRFRSRPRAAANSEVTFGGSMARLVWQEWRQSRGLVRGVALLGVIHLVAVLFMSSQTSDSSHLGQVFAAIPIVAAIFGASVFLADQSRNSYRYFAEHGIGARRVWLSRHLHWAGLLLAWTIVSLFAAGWLVSIDPAIIGAQLTQQGSLLHQAALGAEDGYHIPASSFDALIGVLGTTFVAYCAAQVGSMYFRSALVGFFSGMTLAFFASVWCILMAIGRVPLIWSAVPLPFLMLWITWLRSPDWIAERTSLATKLRAAASLASPLLLVSAVIAYRALSIPAVTVPVTDHVERMPNAEERITAALYIDANELSSRLATAEMEGVGGMGLASEGGDSPASILGLSAEGSVSEDIQNTPPQEPAPDPAEILAKFQEATKRPSCRFAGMYSFTRLVDFIVERAALLEKENKHGEALELYFGLLRMARHYYQMGTSYYQVSGDVLERTVLEHIVRWSARDGLTAEQIGNARERIEQEYFSFSPDRRDAVLSDYVLHKQMLPDYFIRWMPWENVRSRRSLDYWTVKALDELTRVENQLRTQRRPEPGEDVMTFSTQGPMTVAPVRMNPAFHAAQIIQQETIRRSARIRLAALQFRAQMGELPAELAALAPLLGEIPVDPYRGTSFVYSRTGIDLQLPTPVPRDSLQQQAYLSANTPFIWSVGPRLSYPAEVALYGGQEAKLFAERLAGPKMNPNDTWALGWAFEIPVANKP